MSGDERRKAAESIRDKSGVAWWRCFAERWLSEHPDWTQQPPTEQDWYWHWNGDPDCSPLPTSVLFSGADGKCFVSRGQLGLPRAIDCDKYGGWWQRIRTPDLPEKGS